MSPPRDNVFSGGRLDRAAALRRDPDALQDRLQRSDSLWLPLWQTDSLVQGLGAAPTAGWLSAAAAAALRQDDPAATPVFLGLDAERACFALDLIGLASAPVLGDKLAWADLRQVGALLPRADGALLAYARGMILWHRTQRFCGRCAAATVALSGGHLRRCSNPTCGQEHYPRTDPAVIMLVTSGEQCLLGRQPAWPAGMMSTLAGFVEPGETPEEAVAREVFEEAGIAIGEVRYHSAQPWPFPGSLMLGFTAVAEPDQRLAIDHHELETAAWFSRAEIADFARRQLTLPGPASIARRLIEDWLAHG